MIRMREFFYTVIIHLGLLASVSFAQNSVEIFADVSGNDSLQKPVTIFAEQLRKSSSYNFTVQPASSYTGKGIYISSTTAANQKVKPSSKLVKAGTEAFSVDATDQTVKILGNCNMSVGHGIFSYLEFLGYRFYFANPDWHIVPSRLVLFRQWNIVSSPSFHHTSPKQMLIPAGVK